MNIGLLAISLLAIFSSKSLQADTKINGNPYTGQIVISAPGKYSLSDNVVVSPRTSNSAMILIAASDVTLDLNGKTLSISSTCFTPVRTGIQIANGAENVKIFNGTIKGPGTQTTALTSTGIYGYANKNITIDKVTIDQCNAMGIVFDNTNYLNVKRTSVQTVPTGIKIRACYEGSIVDSSFNKSTTAGIDAQDCRTWAISRVNVSNSAGGAVVGFTANRCSGFACTNVRVQNNVGSGAKTGFQIQNSSNNIFTLCDFSNNISTSGAAITGFKCSGVSDYTTSSSLNTFDRCSSKNNSDYEGGATIISFQNSLGSSYNLFKECSALDNTCTATNYGFLCNRYGQGITLEKCKANNNLCGKVGGSYGFALEATKNSTINNCEANGNGCFSTESTGNRSVGVGIALAHNCNTLRVTKNLIIGNRGYRGQFGFIDYGAFESSTQSFPGMYNPSTAGASIMFKGNASLHHGAQALASTSSATANFRFVAGSVYPTPSEVEVDETITAAQAFSDLISTDPDTNISIYITPATTLT